MSCNVVNHEHTSHRVIIYQTALAEMHQARTRAHGNRTKDLCTGWVLTLPQKENENHDEDIKS
jgi:hypothetical protein